MKKLQNSFATNRASFCFTNFIDGTVEGTIITTAEENTKNNSITYIGNGCSGYSPTTTSCSSDEQKTNDNETQKIGVYYNFQAATSGSGRDIDADNTDALDSFCPLGWQLPYAGTGGDYYNQSKSFTFLTDTYSIDNDSAGSRTIRSYPFSYIYSGAYSYNGLTAMSNIGKAWTSTNYLLTRAYAFYIGSGNVRFDQDVKQASFSVRCNSNPNSF